MEVEPTPLGVKIRSLPLVPEDEKKLSEQTIASYQNLYNEDREVLDYLWKVRSQHERSYVSYSLYRHSIKGCPSITTKYNYNELNKLTKRKFFDPKLMRILGCSFEGHLIFGLPRDTSKWDQSLEKISSLLREKRRALSQGDTLKKRVTIAKRLEMEYRKLESLYQSTYRYRHRDMKEFWGRVNRVAPGIFKATQENKDYFLIKNRSQGEIQSLYHEIFVGLHLNRARDEIPIPNFVYTFGFFLCNSPIPSYPDDGNPHYLCDLPGKEGYGVIEKVPGSTLRDHYRDGFNFSFFLSIYLQVLFALNSVQNKGFFFVHNDLHLDNLILRPMNEPVMIPYRFEGKTYYIKTDYIATIIDFDLSFIRLDQTNYHPSDGDYLDYGIYWDKPNPANDAHKLLIYYLDLLLEEGREIEAESALPILQYMVDLDYDQMEDYVRSKVGREELGYFPGGINTKYSHGGLIKRILGAYQSRLNEIVFTDPDCGRERCLYDPTSVPMIDKKVLDRTYERDPYSARSVFLRLYVRNADLTFRKNALEADLFKKVIDLLAKARSHLARVRTNVNTLQEMTQDFSEVRAGNTEQVIQAFTRHRSWSSPFHLANLTISELSLATTYLDMLRLIFNGFYRLSPEIDDLFQTIQNRINSYQNQRKILGQIHSELRNRYDLYQNTIMSYLSRDIPERVEESEPEKMEEDILTPPSIHSPNSIEKRLQNRPLSNVPPEEQVPSDAEIEQRRKNRVRKGRENLIEIINSLQRVRYLNLL